MKPLLIKLLGLAILFGFSTTQVKADDWLVSIGFAGIPSKNIDDQRYDSSLNANLWFGAPQAINVRQGFYINAALPEDVWNNRSNRDRISHTFVNAGFTFSPADSLTLYAGPGFAYQRVNQVSPRDTDHRYRLNGNIGAIIKIGSFGVNFSYDTAPKAFGMGFLIRSSAFQ